MYCVIIIYFSVHQFYTEFNQKIKMDFKWNTLCESSSEVIRASVLVKFSGECSSEVDHARVLVKCFVRVFCWSTLCECSSEEFVREF
jgi:hypothetical protein